MVDYFRNLSLRGNAALLCVVIATAHPVPHSHRVNRLGLVGCRILGFLQAHYQITVTQDLDMDDVVCDYNHLLQTASVHVSG